MPKRKRTSPGKAKRQKHGTGIYLLSGSFPFVSKVGITTNFDARLNGIQAETDAGAWPVLRPVPQPFALDTETTIKNLYKWANAPREGSGGTEWFWNVSPICGTALTVLCWLYYPAVFEGWNLLFVASFFINPVFWLDGILLVLLSRLFWVLLALACAVALYFIIQN